MNTTLEHKSQTANQRAQQHESQSAKAYPSRTIVHAKLEMTEPGDHDEQEADAVANTIMSGAKIARKISGGGGSSGIAVSTQMESQLSQLQGGGRQMPEGLRNMMESGFGQDFSQVRLHTDSEAASLSSSIHAKAFTHGNDIYFNQGQFSPETSEGQHLVAHELTHVVQGTGKVGREEMGEGLLSEGDLLVLNMLTYLPHRNSKEPNTNYIRGKMTNSSVRYLINNIGSPDDWEYEEGETISKDDWKRIFEYIKGNDLYNHIIILDWKTDNYGENSKDCQSEIECNNYYKEKQFSILFFNELSKEIIVAFRGTGKEEWGDNILGAKANPIKGDMGQSTLGQKAALDRYQNYIDYIKKSKIEYKSITTTGHSKGGNKAVFVGLMDDSVDRVVSYDGQGFSDAFYNSNKKRITDNYNKIININASGDFVGLIMNSVGKTKYISVPDDNYTNKKDFTEGHSPEVMFDFNSLLPGNKASLGKEGTQDFKIRILNLNKKIHKFLRTLDKLNGKSISKDKSIDIITKIVQSAMKDGWNLDLLKQIKEENSTEYIDILSYICAFVDSETLLKVLVGEKLDNLKSLLTEEEKKNLEKRTMEFAEKIKEIEIEIGIDNFDDLQIEGHDEQESLADPQK